MSYLWVFFRKGENPRKTNLVTHWLDPEHWTLNTRHMHLTGGTEAWELRICPHWKSWGICLSYGRSYVVHGRWNVTEPNASLMPWMGDPLEWSGSSNIISILDLHRVWWPIELVPETRPDGISIAPRGLYEMHSVPFTIFAGPTTFQSFINNHLIVWEHLQWSYVDAKAILGV